MLWSTSSTLFVYSLYRTRYGGKLNENQLPSLGMGVTLGFSNDVVISLLTPTTKPAANYLLYALYSTQ